jgi:transposase
MKDVNDLLKQWHLDVRAVRERMYRSPTPRERERWHALWLVSRGWSAAQVGEALERDAHTIGDWLADFERAGPVGMAFEQTGGSPPPSTRSSRPS